MKDNGKSITFVELIETIKKMVTSQSNLPKAICFDFFDTLVYRTVAPEHSKKIAAKQLSLLLNGISGETLCGMRRELEKKLCQENIKQGLDPEFKLPDLGTRLHQLLLMMHEEPHVFIEEQTFVKYYCNIEIAVEKSIQRPYVEMRELLSWLQEQAISLCLVSDFYIPQSYFEGLLAHHGMKEFFSEIFISADYGISKGSGKIYSEVCQKLSCSPADVWMIGDNHHADSFMAEKAGLVSFLVDVSEKKDFYENWQAEQDNKGKISLEAIEECERIIANSNAQFFPEMSSTLFLFTKNLFDHLWQKQVKDVFFCSKEGEFLKKLFEVYQDKIFGGQIITCHYLLVSRKATFICSLKSLEHEDFSRLFEHYRDLTLEEFVLSLNFSHAQVESLKSDLGCNWTIRIQNLKEHEDFKSLCSLPLFREMYEQYREEQRSNFLVYIDSFGVDIAADGLHTVDVGWKGSIQNNIYYALGEEISVCGCFLGLLSPSEVGEKNQKNGLVFCDSPSLTPYIHVYNNNRSLFEMMLGASHGSADGYFTEKQYDTVQAQRNSTIRQWTDGDNPVAVTVLDLPEERHLFDQDIAPLQAAFMDVFQQLTEVFIVQDCPPPSLEWFARRHARMLFKPTKREVDFFARLYHLENFGLFEFTSFETNRKSSLKERLRNFVELLKNPAAILETGIWPPIILKRLGLTWLQPIDGWKRYRRIFKDQQ
ncbi:MAG: HAD superfamily hydrolase (TIGR01549 family) [Desulforhopalus sp.]|jgi:HAD superfamily hydrolase (TIGR01549 family)